MNIAVRIVIRTKIKKQCGKYFRKKMLGDIYVSKHFSSQDKLPVSDCQFDKNGQQTATKIRGEIPLIGEIARKIE